MRITNSYGNDRRRLRTFLRESGVKPTIANIEKIQREVSRSQTDNERVERIARETGRGGTFDEKGNVHARVKRMVKKNLAERERR